MRKLALIAALIIGMMASAQEFKFEDDIVDNFGVARVVGSYVVIEKEGTAQELYYLTKQWVMETWKDSEEVIVADNEGSYLKVRGSGMSLPSAKVMGAQFFYDRVMYSISFRFKDGRLKMEIEGIDAYVAPTYNRYGSTPGGWGDFQYAMYKKQNKKGKWKVIENGMLQIESCKVFFNDLAYRLNSYSASSVTAENETW